MCSMSCSVFTLRKFPVKNRCLHRETLLFESNHQSSKSLALSEYCRVRFEALSLSIECFQLLSLHPQLMFVTTHLCSSLHISVLPLVRT